MFVASLVLDYFGSGIPVCAVDYQCIDELVKHDENGFVFSGSEALASQLSHLLRGFPNSKTLAKLQAGVQEGTRWEGNWLKHELPVVISTMEHKTRAPLPFLCISVLSLFLARLLF